jgi:hypothetical protein
MKNETKKQSEDKMIYKDEVNYELDLSVKNDIYKHKAGLELSGMLLTESDLYFEAKAALETEVKKALNLTKGF